MDKALWKHGSSLKAGQRKQRSKQEQRKKDKTGSRVQNLVTNRCCGPNPGNGTLVFGGFAVFGHVELKVLAGQL
ncbi:hypothetical protein CEXT_82021 [Caerostris extrusa]|uniref:40S ribosomal protein S30 n=1 Tax=Caerostris extrusa TaxID=172846 RepID=A0AAV4Q657_CAEEX|nr:hypothetical protein CEXT_82021 [Caerostris extrusa]